MRIVSVSKGTLGVPALNDVTSLVILRLAYVGRRSCRRYARSALRNRLVVWSTAILTHLPVLAFHIIIGSDARFYAPDFHRADVGL